MPVYDSKNQSEQSQRNGCYLVSRRRSGCTNPAMVEFTMVCMDVSMHVGLGQLDARWQLQWRAPCEHVLQHSKGRHDQFHRNFRAVSHNLADALYQSV